MLQRFTWSRWRARGSKTYYLGISKVFLERYEWCLLEQKMTVGIKIFTEVPATQFYSDCDSCVCGGVSGWKQVLNSDSDRCAQPEHSLGFTLGSDVLSVPSLVGMNKGYGALFNEMNGTKKYSTVKYYVNIDFVLIVCLWTWPLSIETTQIQLQCAHWETKHVVFRFLLWVSMEGWLLMDRTWRNEAINPFRLTILVRCPPYY